MSFESHQYKCSCETIGTNALVNLNVLEIPLEKELILNCLVETCTKLGEMILAAIVLCGLIGNHTLSGLQRTLYDDIFVMVLLGPQWSANIGKMC